MKCSVNYSDRSLMPELPVTLCWRKLDPDTMLTKLLDPSARARFWRFVRKGDGCWLWTGSTTGQLNHGQFHLGRIGGHVYHEYAHRVSWMLAHGPIPCGQQINHHCDVPACVNPDHLYLGTQGDNVRDGVRRGRYPKYRAPRKMTAEQVREARALRGRGWKLADLANRYDASEGYLSMVCGGKRRTHLPDVPAVAHPASWRASVPADPALAQGQEYGRSR